MRANTGHDGTLSFAYESSFGGGVGDATLYPFGKEATLGSLESNNNLTRVYEPDSRDPDQMVERQFEGSYTVDFTVSNPYFLGGLISGGPTGPWSGEIPGTIALVQGINGTVERELVGGIVTSGTISAEEGDSVSGSLEVAFADENSQTTVQSQPTEDNRALQFHDATVNIGGSQPSLTQSFELSIENNSEMIWELGSRFAAAYALRQREISLEYGGIVVEDDTMTRIFGSSSASSPASTVTNSTDATINLDDGGSKTMSVGVDGLLPNSYTIEGIGDPEADIEETMSEYATGVNATASGFGVA